MVKENLDYKENKKITRGLFVSPKEAVAFAKNNVALDFFIDLLIKIVISLAILTIGVQIGIAEGRKLERNDILQSWSAGI